MDMTRALLLQRLTNHLAGEASFDAVDLDQRNAAIDEAYNFISEKWQLYTKPYAFGQPNDLIAEDNLPTDFQSYTGLSGTYNALPPPLINDASIPWNGRYPTAAMAISYYAAYRIYEDKGPEMYERAGWWKKRFDEYAERLDAEQKRRSRSAIDALANPQPYSFGDLLRQVYQNLDVTDMSEEDRRRKFPPDVIYGTVNRAYQDISNKFELNVGLITAEIPVSGSLTLLPPEFVAPSMSHATLNGIPVSKVAGSILSETTAEVVSWFTEAPSYRIVTLGASRWVQFSGLPITEYPATFALFYDGKTTPMVALAAKPWGGLYDDAFKLIIFKAMRDMMYGDPKTYNMSRFWQNEYDREEREFKRILRRIDGGARVAVFGYSRTENETHRSGFVPIGSGDE